MNPKGLSKNRILYTTAHNVDSALCLMYNYEKEKGNKIMYVTLKINKLIGEDTSIVNDGNLYEIFFHSFNNDPSEIYNTIKKTNRYIRVCGQELPVYFFQFDNDFIGKGETNCLIPGHFGSGPFIVFNNCTNEIIGLFDNWGHPLLLK